MNILLIDLTSPAVRFKLTPPGESLPAVAPGSTTPNWPVVPFEVVRQRTLDFLNSSHAQAGINVHFFAPFPVPGGSTQGAYAYVIGLAGSRGKIYSGFEAPIQSYAIVTDSPGLNIDSSNDATIVHRHPDSADGMDVLENVELWNALAGSGQILSASFGVAAAGVTRVSFSATDAAGNEETARTLDVKIDGAPPVLSGLPSEGCTLWPTNHKLQRVALLGASDLASGIARGSFQVHATSNEPMDRATWPSPRTRTAD
jgi:hypothetical protein